MVKRAKYAECRMQNAMARYSVTRRPRIMRPRALIPQNPSVACDSFHANYKGRQLSRVPVRISHLWRHTHLHPDGILLLGLHGICREPHPASHTRLACLDQSFSPHVSYSIAKIVSHSTHLFSEAYISRSLAAQHSRDLRDHADAFPSFCIVHRHLLLVCSFPPPNITGVGHLHDVFTTIPDSKGGEAVLLVNASV
jgi:hypothetical protein